MCREAGVNNRRENEGGHLLECNQTIYLTDTWRYIVKISTTVKVFMKQSKVLRHVILFLMVCSDDWQPLAWIMCSIIFICRVGRALGYAGIVVDGIVCIFTSAEFWKEGSLENGWCFMNIWPGWVLFYFCTCFQHPHQCHHTQTGGGYVIDQCSKRPLVGKFFGRQSIEHLEESKLSLAKTGLDRRYKQAFF